MPIGMKWCCKGRVVYVRVVGDLHIDEFYKTASTFRQLIDYSDAPLVHLIADLSEWQSSPSLGAMIRAVKVPSRIARIGWTLYIGVSGGKPVHFFASVVYSALQLRFREMNSLDEALTYLQKMDPDLPDLQRFRYTDDSLDTVAEAKQATTGR
jgi:hypothetical protein